MSFEVTEQQRQEQPASHQITDDKVRQESGSQGAHAPFGKTADENEEAESESSTPQESNDDKHEYAENPIGHDAAGIISVSCRDDVIVSDDVTAPVCLSLAHNDVRELSQQSRFPNFSCRRLGKLLRL